EYLNEYAIDRVETIGVGYLGHTVGCARCHDHKYDPVSIKDFYSFAAFFSNTNEPGFYSPGSVPSVEVGPTLLLPSDETKTKLKDLTADIGRKQAVVDEALRRATASSQERVSVLRSP